jgi:hypothetical protein
MSPVPRAREAVLSIRLLLRSRRQPTRVNAGGLRSRSSAVLASGHVGMVGEVRLRRNPTHRGGGRGVKCHARRRENVRPQQSLRRLRRHAVAVAHFAERHVRYGRVTEERTCRGRAVQGRVRAAIFWRDGTGKRQETRTESPAKNATPNRSVRHQSGTWTDAGHCR